MMSLALFFLLNVLLAAILVFVMVYYVIMYSDLEMDYLNPIELCRRLNHFVVPEMALHVGMTVMFLLTGQFIIFLWNVPLVIFHAYGFNEKSCWYEPTDIFRELPYRKKIAMAKLVFFLLSFFVYLFKMVGALLD